MLATPLWERWGFGKQNHAVDGGGISYGVGADEVIDSQLKVPLPMPEDQALSASDLAAYSRVQDVAPQTWYGSVNPSGQADFYVQYNGMPYSEQAGRSRFLGGVSIGGIWYSIPFPALPSTPLPSIEDHYCAHDGDPGCQPEAGVDKAGHDVGAYARARQNMLGPLIEEKRPTYVMPGDHRDAAGNSPLVGCELTEPHTHSPRRIVTREINSGPNAGVTITVELVNARTQGDQLADGFSVKASADAHLEEGKWKWVDRRCRHHPSPSLGPATQMTNTSRCFDIPSETYPWHVDIDGTRENNVSKNRSQAAWNRWKTLYKVSISGLPRSDHLYFRYDGTGVTTTTLTDGAKVLISAERLDLSGYRSNENMESAWTNFLGLDANDSGVVRASDMVYASTTNPGHPDDGNVRITLKPGYVNPVLTTVTGRTDLGVTSAACGPESTSCRVVRHDAPSADGSDGGTVTYAWKPTFVSDEPVRYGGDADAHARIGTSVAEPMEITADLLAVPVVAMAADDSGTPTGAASSAVVPEQWDKSSDGDPSGQLRPRSADMGAGRFIHVTGSTPVPTSQSLTFAGYKLVGADASCPGAEQGVACTTTTNLSDDLYFPGDTIDLDALRLTGGLNLVNDELTAGRYAALWLVPTFAVPGTSAALHGATSASGADIARPHLPLYRVDELVEGDNSLFHRHDDARHGVYHQFAAAPDLTAALTEEALAHKPAVVEGRSFRPALSRVRAVIAASTSPASNDGEASDDVVMQDPEGHRADRAAAEPARPLWLAYNCGEAVCGQRATLEVEVVDVDQALPGVTQPADPAAAPTGQPGTPGMDGLEARDGSHPVEGALLSGSLRQGADQATEVTRQGYGLVNLPGEVEDGDPDIRKAREADTLEASWSWRERDSDLSRWYAVDNWACRGQEGDAKVDAATVTARLAPDESVRCTLTFHTSQMTLLVSGLDMEGQGTEVPGLNVRSTAGDEDSSESLYSSTATVADLVSPGTMNTVYLGPHARYRLGGAPWIATRYLARWQRYTGERPNNPEVADPTMWEDLPTAGGTAEVTLAPDTHQVYRAVYAQALLPQLPFTGASAQLYLLVGLILAGLAAASAPWVQRRGSARS